MEFSMTQNDVFDNCLDTLRDITTENTKVVYARCFLEGKLDFFIQTYQHTITITFIEDKNKSSEVPRQSLEYTLQKDNLCLKQLIRLIFINYNIPDVDVFLTLYV